MGSFSATAISTVSVRSHTRITTASPLAQPTTVQATVFITAPKKGKRAMRKRITPAYVQQLERYAERVPSEQNQRAARIARAKLNSQPNKEELEAELAELYELGDEYEEERQYLERKLAKCS